MAPCANGIVATYTILVGRTSLWNVTAGQTVDVVIKGSVYGADGNQNWPHFNERKGGTLLGQTGNGSEENITAVDCSSHQACLDANRGVSDVVCSATSPRTNCTDQQSVAPFGAYKATFRAATFADPYAFTVEVKLAGGRTGMASLYSVGVHLGVAR